MIARGFVFTFALALAFSQNVQAVETDPGDGPMTSPIVQPDSALTAGQAPFDR